MDDKLFKYDDIDIIYTVSRYTNSKELIVVFSGFTKINAVDRHPYNFQNVLSDFPANILYIRDNLGNRGVYYLAYNGDFRVCEAICALIKKICCDYNIELRRVITVGSSKGGSAALHIGLKLNCGYIISAVPQLLIATYCKNECSDTYQDIINNKDDFELQKRIDEYILMQIKNEYESNIYLLSSENDEQFPSQIKPVLPILEMRDSNTIIIDNRIKNHDDCKNYLSDFVVSTLVTIVFGIKFSKTDNNIFISKISNEYYDISLGVLEVDKPISVISVIDSIKINTDRLVHIELFVKKDNMCIFSWKIYNWLKHLTTAKIELNNGNAVLTIINKKKLLRPVQYALYQFSGGNIQTTFPYQISNVFVLNIENELMPNIFQLFVKDKDGKSSNRITLNDIVFENNLQRKLFCLKYSFEINDDVLKFKLFDKDSVKDNFLYCFYIVCNSTVIYKGKYGKKTEISFGITESGKYRIIYFINDNGHKEYMYSRCLEYKKKQ